MLIDWVKPPSAGSALPRSLYARENGPATRTLALQGQVETDFAIVGGGITGLSTAIALARQGLQPLILEANEVGWGASGRNGGQVNPGLKDSPQALVDHCGNREIVAFSWDAPNRVKEHILEFAIECDFQQAGSYRAAIGAGNVQALEDLARELDAFGIDNRLDSEKVMRSVTGTKRYQAGLMMPQGGQLDPLRYTRGLARAALSLGATLYEDTPVLSVVRQSDGRWLLQTAQGTVLARRILIATNGYSGALIPKLRRSLLPIFSAIVASRPLPLELRTQILAEGQVLYEAGRITTYYRVDAQGRLIFGGRGKMRPAEGAQSFANLTTYAARLWPDLERVGWEEGWNGRICMTADHYPHLHDLGDGRVVFVGYNGRGVAMATAIGERLARYLENPNAGFILPVTHISPIAFQPFWPMGILPAIWWNQWCDRFENR